MRRTFPSCSGSAPTSIHARPSATKATPARPTAKPHAIAASFPSSRPRRTRRTGPPSSPERSTGGVPASSRPSASSNASSASPYAARRQSETLLPSSRSSQASSWPNPSTRPNNMSDKYCGCHSSNWAREALRCRRRTLAHGLTFFAEEPRYLNRCAERLPCPLQGRGAAIPPLSACTVLQTACHRFPS